MSCKLIVSAFLLAAVIVPGVRSANAQQPSGNPPPGQQGTQAFGRQWGYSQSTHDWNRFFHYPYVFYPQNFYSDTYMRSAEDLYHRYPQEMRVPVYNRDWQNYYPKARRYHQGHHFILDVF